MPIRNGWLPREGLTIDPIGRLIKKTAFNPAFTLIFILLARYTKKGSDLSILHEKAYSRIRKLFYLGLLRWASNFLDSGTLDNWSKNACNWDNEIVLITGGAGGIGGHVVRLLAERGIKIVVLDIMPMSFEAPPNVHHFTCDITSPQAISRIATEVRSKVGPPTILINNAGVCRGRTILSSTEKDIRFTFEVNTLAHYWLVQEFLPSMISSNHGMIVTMASMGGYVTVPGLTDYCASKASAIAFHEGLASELTERYKADKVRTILVTTGFAKTQLFEGHHNDASFIMPTLELETVAEEIVKAVLRGRSGQVSLPGGCNFMSALRGAPVWLQRRLRNDQRKTMLGWRGRQVLDLENWVGNKKEEGSGSEEESTSTVLVPPAKD